MSRLARYPIKVPNEVKFSIDQNSIEFSGPLGKSKYIIPSICELKVEDNNISVVMKIQSPMSGTIRQLINNKCLGVYKGFQKKLNIKGVGYRAAINSRVLKMELGLSHSCEYKIPDGIDITVEKNVNLTIKGIDKHQVGQAAADVKKYRPPERYKGSGIHIVGQPVIIKQRKK